MSQACQSPTEPGGSPYANDYGVQPYPPEQGGPDTADADAGGLEDSFAQTTAGRRAVSQSTPADPVGCSGGHRRVWQRLLFRPGSAFGLAILLLILICSLLSPWITPYDPNDQMFDGLTIEGAPLPPSSNFWMGTDLLGRDLFSRLLLGARTSLLIGVVANGLSVAFGTLIGVTAGFFGGPVGSLLMRFTDLMMAFPALLLAVVLSALFEPGLWIVALVIAMVNWVQMARVVYTQTCALKQRDFIQAQIAMGAGPLRILFRHVLPQLLSAVVVFGTLGISTTVLLEATLSYLGVGVQPPTPSWGGIIQENQTYFSSAPWLVFIPGSAILLLALAFNLVGDALRDILDPTLKGRH